MLFSFQSINANYQLTHVIICYNCCDIHKVQRCWDCMFFGSCQVFCAQDSEGVGSLHCSEVQKSFIVFRLYQDTTIHTASTEHYWHESSKPVDFEKVILHQAKGWEYLNLLKWNGTQEILHFFLSTGGLT